MNKISICTVCMNRGIHLHETLSANIINNISYPHLEFIVLDYNSQDGLEDWAKSAMQRHIKSGVLKYYKTYEPKYFDLSHSKNMALKLSSGDICCLVDADNFAGPDYAGWVNSVYGNTTEKIIVTTLRQDSIPFRDQGGKLCFRKDHLHSISGFDESMIGYGIDDVDLVNRLEKSGGKRFYIENEKYLKFIPHSNAERLKNHHLINNLTALYAKESASMLTDLKALYLLKDMSFMEVHYSFDAEQAGKTVQSYGGWGIVKGGLKKGRYEQANNSLLLTFENASSIVYRVEGSGISTFLNGKKTPWKKIASNEEMFSMLVMGYGECVNRIKYLENNENILEVNKKGWGQGTVYLNFDRSQPIKI